MDMNVIELPNAGTPAVLVAAAPVAGKELVMGFCLPTTIIDKTHQDPLGVTPNADARSYFWLYNKQQEVALPSFDSVRIVKQPAHGQLIREKNAAGRDVYVYRPSFGYLGKDRFEAVVPVGNDTVRIIYYIVVQKDLTDQDGFDSKKYCPKSEWKISLPAGTDPSLQKIVSQALSSSGLAPTFSFTALDELTLAQTTGQGKDATITLDPTAAGHGWFIDPTPTNNEEFLPTADPNVWMAKPGSAAEGHMDMLSVLLHEYGHVLGLEHSADGADGMAATLKPGGRLWSAGDLAALARLGVSYVQNADGSLTLASA